MGTNDYPWLNNSKQQLGWTKASREGAYSRKRWRDLRDYKLSLNPLCEECETKGKTVAATEVDHITPVSEVLGECDPVFYDLSNLRSLCTSCHRRLTRKDNSKYSDGNITKGKLLMKKLESNAKTRNN